MIARRSGRIVNIASGVGLRPLTYSSAYGCSKMVLVWLTDCLQVEGAIHPWRARWHRLPVTRTFRRRGAREQFGIGMVRSIPTCTVDGHQSRGSKSNENHAKYDTTNPAAIRWVIHRVNRTGTGEPPVSPRSLTISSSLRCAAVT